jgi:ATP-dependent Lhr-like helicase
MTETQSELKRSLKDVWFTFFSRYGKLFPIQEKTIPVVLGGKNAVIVSPTASGKTEAVVAPLIERFLSEGWEGLAILYISPTRALVNDVYYRLKDQLAELNVSLLMRTGDKPSFNPNKLPNFLITTPESLDSLLCRYPASFRGVRAVILDDIHLIDGTYRGDQVRILLKRLKFITERDFNVYILSATVYDPWKMGSRYMENFEVIQSPGQRELDYTLVRSLEEVFSYAREEGLRKLLIFCNKRAEVERLADECSKLWGRNYVVVHHGSLSKQVREEAEEFMRETRYGVCIATMTLEVGIDIGDIDAVVLAEVPWNISSLLQRIGRGNRRTGRCRVFAIFRSENERLLLDEMLKAAKEGRLEYEEYSPDLSVVVQQIFSSLYANPGGLDIDYFNKLFDGFCTKSELRDIINHLINVGLIEKTDNKIYATTKIMDLGEKGKIHSNIPQLKGMKVVDESSGKTIGEIQYPLDSDVFVLAGKVWRVTKVVESESKIYVKQEKVSAIAASFKAHRSRGCFHRFLPEHLK